MPKKPSVPVRNRFRSAPTTRRDLTTTAPQSGRKITSKATTLSGSHSVVLPTWAALPIKWAARFIDWAGRNKKPIAWTGFAIALIYAPYTWHSVTTHKLAAVCDDISYSQVVVDRWGCGEGSECTDRELGLAASYTLATAYSATHCEQLDGPPAPHTLALAAWNYAIQSTVPPGAMLPETRTAEANSY